MDCNRNAPLVVEHECLIAASAENLWQIMTAVESWSQWNPVIQSSALSSPLAEGTTFTWASRGLNIDATIRCFDKPRCLGWTGKLMGVEAVHVWHFIQSPQGATLVRTAESLEGMMVGFMRDTLHNALDESLKAWLQALKQQAEK